MEQSRKKFLRNMLIGATSVPLIIQAACKKADVTSNSGSGSGTGTGTGSGSCAVTPTETEGPFPTHTPSSYVRSDIRDDRSGVLLAVSITIKNSNASCAALAGATRKTSDTSPKII